MIDLEKASEFMRTRARLLDQRRFELLLGDASREAALAALSGYANPDGGFGHGLEPDLRSATSQPGGALHAFEVFEEIGRGASLARVGDRLLPRRHRRPRRGTVRDRLPLRPQAPGRCPRRSRRRAR